MALITEIRASLTARETGSNDFGGPEFNPDMEILMQLGSGTAAGQADLAWFDERAVGASSNDDIDLAGILTSSFGATLTFAKIVALFIINKPKAAGANANVSNLTVGVGSNPFLGFLGGTTPTFGPIRPGSFLFMGATDVSAYGSVTGGSADILRVANGSGGGAVYQIGLIGRSS